MAGDQGHKKCDRTETSGPGREGFLSKEGDLSKVEVRRGEEGSMPGYICRQGRVEEYRECEGSESPGLEGSEQAARDNAARADKPDEEEEWLDEEVDITGIINMLEIHNPQFRDKADETREIRRSTKRRKKLADELGQILLHFV